MTLAAEKSSKQPTALTSSIWIGSTPYILAVLVSVSTWFLAIGAPLFVDETGSFWRIDGGLSRLLQPCPYYYLLWAWTRIFGTSEVALRILSVIPMGGAAWLLYLIGRRLFDRELAFIAVIIFCLDPITIFEAVDIRPYSSIVFVDCLAIYLLLRLRGSRSVMLAVAFGLTTSLILWFHLLSLIILPSLLVGFFIVKSDDRVNRWRQLGAALAAFVVASVPLVRFFLYRTRTATTSIYEKAPKFATLLLTIAPRWLPIIFIAVALAALMLAALRPRDFRQQDPHSTSNLNTLLLSAVLGLIPLFILYGVSVGTSIHVFAFRHRLDAVPGIALCWTWLISRFRPPILKRVFIFLLVALTVFSYWRSPASRNHGFSWKQALQVTEQAAAPSNAPVLMCSTFVESNYSPLPLNDVRSNSLFAPLSYYKLTVPVVPLPRAFNAQAMQIGTRFLQQATERRQQFFVDGYIPSYPTLQWLTEQAEPNFNVRELGNFDGYKVLEFTPRPANSYPDAAPNNPHAAFSGNAQPPES